MPKFSAHVLLLIMCFGIAMFIGVVVGILPNGHSLSISLLFYLLGIVAGVASTLLAIDK